jgi:hypothetical protein
MQFAENLLHLQQIFRIITKTLILIKRRDEFHMLFFGGPETFKLTF